MAELLFFATEVVVEVVRRSCVGASGNRMNSLGTSSGSPVSSSKYPPTLRWERRTR